MYAVVDDHGGLNLPALPQEPTYANDYIQLVLWTLSIHLCIYSCIWADLSSIYGNFWISDCPMQCDSGCVKEWRLLCANLRKDHSISHMH